MTDQRRTDSGLTISDAAGTADLDDVRTIFREYQDWLDAEICFQDFESEMASLPGAYEPPAGCLLLARGGDDEAAAAVGVKPVGAKECEMKRLYVRPPWRGGGLGRTMTEMAIERARRAGFETMRLETLPKLQAAIALYESLGFAEVTPHVRESSVEVLIFAKNL